MNILDVGEYSREYEVLLQREREREANRNKEGINMK